MAHHDPKNSSDFPSQQSSSDAGGKPALSRHVQAELGQRLRAFYEALALGEQPVPDRFIELIDRLGESQPESRPEKRS